jgi:hypothetical protein
VTSRRGKRRIPERTVTLAGDGMVIRVDRDLLDRATGRASAPASRKTTKISEAPHTKSTPRTKFLDYDARRTPKTDFSCVLCQRDLKPGDRKVRWVHVVDDTCVLHPADEVLYTPDAHDRGTFPIGPECVKKIGAEWTRSSADLTAKESAGW